MLCAYNSHFAHSVCPLETSGHWSLIKKLSWIQCAFRTLKCFAVLEMKCFFTSHHQGMLRTQTNTDSVWAQHNARDAVWHAGVLCLVVCFEICTCSIFIRSLSKDLYSICLTEINTIVRHVTRTQLVNTESQSQPWLMDHKQTCSRSS